MAVDFGYIGPTCQKIEDMIAFARPIIGRWPPFYRYTLGEDVYRQMIQLLRLATKARLKYYNKTTLQELDTEKELSLIHISEPTRQAEISYAVFCLKKKKKKKQHEKKKQ